MAPARRRPVPALGAAALVVVALVGGTAAACTDGPERDPVGTVVVADIGTEVEGGSSGFLLVPAGRIDVTVGPRVTGTLPASVAADETEHTPPAGGSFVPVAWSHNPFALPSGMAPVGTDPRPTEMALVVDGTSYPLGSPYDVASVGGTIDSPIRVMYVAVPGVPDSVVVSAEYHGLTQTLDPQSGQLGPGAAAPLYHHIDHVGPRRCAAGWSGLENLVAVTSCRVREPQRLPYLPEVGWAAPERSWVVIGYRITLEGARPAAVTDRLGVRQVTADLTLNGARPVVDRSGPAAGSRRPGTVTGTLAFDGPLTGGRLAWGVGVTVEPVDATDGAPGLAELALTRVLRLQ